NFLLFGFSMGNNTSRFISEALNRFIRNPVGLPTFTSSKLEHAVTMITKKQKPDKNGNLGFLITLDIYFFH
ncbi:MAG: hypothetical protein KAX05_07885, partial [Bacteroidales bacterium]|nr:hypothetical protein [Bacteroidales bacterium]